MSVIHLFFVLLLVCECLTSNKVIIVVLIISVAREGPLHDTYK